MTAAYLAAAVVGLVLLGASFFGVGHGHEVGHGGDSESPAAALLSVRVWTYLLAFGGATGLLLRAAGELEEPWRAATALAVGAIAAAVARTVIARASRAGSSGTVRTAELVGRTAGVIVPFAAGATGKVRLRVADAEVDLLATTDDAEPLGADDEVLIVELREGGALVTRSPR